MTVRSGVHVRIANMNTNDRKYTAVTIPAILGIIYLGDAASGIAHDTVWRSVRRDWLVSEKPTRDTLRFVFGALFGTDDEVSEYPHLQDMVDQCKTMFMGEFVPDDVE